MSRVQSKVFWIIVVALLLLTRIPAASQYLSIDNVNLAYSLEKFDPTIHQPQPPGYPFFVGFAKLINLLSGNAERTFLFISILICGLCLPAAGALGRRMFNPWVGYGAVLLLLFNPVFWSTGLDGPLRPFLALFSILIAYCSWQAWCGEKHFVIWGAVALGIGSGFRPDILIYLGPLWLIAAWMGTRSVKRVLIGSAVLGAMMLVWVGALVIAIGGFGALYHLLTNYLVEQARPESVVLGSSLHDWLRQVNRVVIWNGMAIVVFIWATPLFFMSKARVGLFSRQMWFIKAWLIPGFLFQAFIHIDAPGHTVFSMPALCIIGAYVLWAAAQYWKSEDMAPRMAEVFLLVAVSLNLLMFLNYFELPNSAAAPTGGGGSIKNALSFGVFESSIGEVRWLDNITRVSLDEIRKFSAVDKPAIVVTQDMYDKNWFMNWRIARYYLPTAKLRVVADQKTPLEVFTVVRDLVAKPVAGDTVIHLQRPSRILWLLEIGGKFDLALDKAVPVVRGEKVSYSDIGADAQPFQVLNFTFVPDVPAVPSTNGIPNGVQ